MKRSFMFWLYFVVAIVLGVYFATRIIMNTMGHGKIATVHNISITANNYDHDLLPIKTAASSALGVQTRALDLDILNNRIKSVPGVRNSATRRLPNGTLRVRVEMHRAIGMWTDGAAFYPLAADGTMINIPSDARDDGAIVFRGELPENIADITDAARPIANTIDYIEWIENRRWNIVTTGGITVMLPEEEPTAALRELISLNEKKNILGRDIKILDMRDSARILVK